MATTYCQDLRSLAHASRGSVRRPLRNIMVNYDPSVKPTSPVWNSGHSLSTGMIAAYLFNEGSGTSLSDSTGQLSAATLSNGSWGTDTPGAIINFSNANTKITLPSLSGLFGTNEASILYVLKLSADPPVDTQHSGLSTIGGAIAATHYPYDGDGLIYSADFLGVRAAGKDDGTFNKASWHRYGVTTKNGAGNHKLYQNGASFGSAAGEATISLAATQLIGQSVGDVWFTGSMASVTIWSRELSAAEMLTLETDPWVMFR